MNLKFYNEKRTIPYFKGIAERRKTMIFDAKGCGADRKAPANT